MIIKRNDFTMRLECSLNKEQKKILNNVAGTRPHFICLLSCIVDFCNDCWQYSPKTPRTMLFEDYVPTRIRQFYDVHNACGKWDRLIFNTSKVPHGYLIQWYEEINKELFKFILENKDEVSYDETLLHKNVENILKIVKFTIDDFS